MNFSIACKADDYDCMQFFAYSSLQFILFDITSWFAFVLLSTEWKVLKSTIMQIEKALINDRLNVSKVSWKFRIPTIYNFAVIYSWNLLFS